jgi:hypothetical protein
LEVKLVTTLPRHIRSGGFRWKEAGRFNQVRADPDRTIRSEISQTRREAATLQIASELLLDEARQSLPVAELRAPQHRDHGFHGIVITHSSAS